MILRVFNFFKSDSTLNDRGILFFKELTYCNKRKTTLLLYKSTSIVNYIGKCFSQYTCEGEVRFNNFRDLVFVHEIM